VSEVEGTVVGVGVDVISVDRVASSVRRQPGILERLFTSGERAVIERGRSLDAARRSMAGRFAAKEAVMKALGVGLGEVDFADIEVLGGRGGAPEIALHGRARDRAEALGVATVSISMSHDAGVALAFAVASRPVA
jgi:holo-[acyl-carrier protein] synthase